MKKHLTALAKIIVISAIVLLAINLIDGKTKVSGIVTQNGCFDSTGDLGCGLSLKDKVHGEVSVIYDDGNSLNPQKMVFHNNEKEHDFHHIKIGTEIEVSGKQKTFNGHLSVYPDDGFRILSAPENKDLTP